jgi:hypothetical protein
MTIARRLSRSGPAVFSSWAVFLSRAVLVASTLSLGACSSGDDVVASVEEPAPGALSSGESGGAPLRVVQLGAPTPAPGAPAPAGASLAPPLAGTASAGIGRPPPPRAVLIGEALYVSGTEQSPPRAGAERWPLDEPLRQLFPPAPEPHRVLVVRGAAHDTLRELAARHGLGVAARTVRVLVEDDAGDQFELLLSDDPPLADGPMPASD